MTKLIYPEEGLVSIQSKNMEISKVNLEKLSQISLDIPNSFDSKRNLKDLIFDINESLEDHNKLQRLLEKNDNNYKNVGNKINDNFKVRNTIKISKREKII